MENNSYQRLPIKLTEIQINLQRLFVLFVIYLTMQKPAHGCGRFRYWLPDEFSDFNKIEQATK